MLNNKVEKILGGEIRKSTIKDPKMLIRRNGPGKVDTKEVGKFSLRGELGVTGGGLRTKGFSDSQKRRKRRPVDSSYTLSSKILLETLKVPRKCGMKLSRL